MKIPEGMTEEAVLATIEKVTNTLKHKFKFKYHEAEDIKQQGFLICLLALEKYDGKRPLENFLFVNLRNRLLNFMRDNYKRAHEDVCLENEEGIIDEIREKSSFLVNFESHIDELLPPDLRNDYLKIKDGIKLPRQRRIRLENKIRELIRDGDLYD